MCATWDSALLGLRELQVTSHYPCHLDFFTVMSLALGCRNLCEDQPHFNNAATILPPEPKNFDFPEAFRLVHADRPRHVVYKRRRLKKNRSDSEIVICKFFFLLHVSVTDHLLYNELTALCDS